MCAEMETYETHQYFSCNEQWMKWIGVEREMFSLYGRELAYSLMYRVAKCELTKIKICELMVYWDHPSKQD